MITDKSLIVPQDRKKKAPPKPFNWASVPKVHWCGHYFNKRGKAIPDGAICCWRHWIGLPTRWGQRHPYYSWQEQVINEFYKYHYFWMKKPPKIGASETYLHLAMHEACVNPLWRNGQVAIVVGTTGMAEGEKMIDRCKNALKVRGLPINDDYNTKTEFSLNTVEFRAHPADNVDAIRSKPNMRMIIIDEGAFFRQKDQQKVRAAFEHYIGGSGTKIVALSTAGDAPEGFMYDIEKEPDVKDGGVYRHYSYDYKTGLEVHPESKTSLYNMDMIKQAMTLPSFPRNYLGMWGHGSGDIFSLSAVEAISKEIYATGKPGERTRVLSIDPAYGSSKSALVGMEEKDGIAYVVQAEQVSRPSQTELIALINKSIEKHGYTIIQVDSAHPGLLAEFSSKMSAVPVNFREKGQLMTDGAARRVNEQSVRILPDMIELTQQLKAAKKNEKGTVDKKIATFDLFDAFIMSLDYFTSGVTAWADLGSD